MVKSTTFPLGTKQEFPMENGKWNIVSFIYIDLYCQCMHNHIHIWSLYGIAMSRGN